MTVAVRVPHGLAWSTGGQNRVQAQGSTLGEVWSDLRATYPELMWRLSLEQGRPSFWVGISLNGEPMERPARLDAPLSDGSELTLQIIPGSGAASGAASGKPPPSGSGANRG
jgi:molybdopterin synthase sulfur carrier subunit